METDRKKEVVELTSRIMHNLYRSNLEEWFDALRKDSIWVGSGEPFLYGAESIKAYFKNYHMPSDVKIVNETYTPIVLGNTSYIVSGLLSIGREDGTITASTIITVVYRYIGDKPTIAYHHMSYDYTDHFSNEIKNNLNLNTPQQPMNASTRLFIKQMIMNTGNVTHIPIKVGKQINYVDPRTIIYLNSHGHKTTLYCIDKVIDCSMNIYEFEPLLDNTFYPLRRGCIINTKYITALRRSEVELVYKTIIQIPVPSYTKVKKELNALITK